MPALSLLHPLLDLLIKRNDTAGSFPVLDGGEKTDHFDVICAWPVSGQYGPGTRFLYYVLVATCVLGKNSEWLKDACLAAALLLPAVAAIHGIVLAAVHVDGAVDMDVYGAFQLCAIGVLAGPLTVKISATYFNTPGRNLIFLWTGVILAGLLSLTAEFFRATPQSCLASEFQWGLDTSCNIACSPDDGPASPLRGGSQNNIYVIKAPRFLPLGTATLLSAACCIPAILSLVSTWNKILKLNWMKRWGDVPGTEDLNKPISGTNEATPAKMMKVNDRLHFYLSMVEIPVFGAAILGILAVGERNFFDFRVNYMTEPIASVGQWAPIVGTGLAAMGSLYALLAHGGRLGGNGTEEIIVEAGFHHCSCSHHRVSHDEDASINPPSRGEHGDETEMSDHDGHAPVSHTSPLARAITTPKSGATFDHYERRMTTSTLPSPNSPTDAGSRRRVARAFEMLGDRLGNPAPDAFDDSAFRGGRAAGFPTIPGEKQRNPALPLFQRSYNPSDGDIVDPLRRQRSRAGSFVDGEVVSPGLGGERSEVELRDGGREAEAVVRAAVRSRPEAEGEVSRVRRATLGVPTLGYLQSAMPRTRSAPGGLGEGGRDKDPPSPAITISQHPLSS